MHWLVGGKGAETVKTNTHRSGSAFTLLEIMIVVGIIGLLCMLVIPGFMRDRKLSEARRIINDARQMDIAIDQWGMEMGVSNGAPIDTVGAAKYLKRPWPITDMMGNAYVVNTVGPTQIQIAVTTKAALDGVGIDWGAY